MTAAQLRQNIVLDAVIHNDNTTITDIAINSIQAYQYGNAMFDYIRKLGPINDGNGYSSGGANLSVAKAAGTTTLPWINRNIDAQNPTESINGVISPLTGADWSAFYQDGSGGFNIEIEKTAVDPD
ncbi:MAG: hypothetical protein IH796_07170, partial [Deltaproteobacteria bacterium]|nr:hypothetical protein [Deltaproteobacteria bacterium]